jgi:hypothetical protein
MANKNEYQAYFLDGKASRCVELTTQPPSYVDCLEIWKHRIPGILRICPGLWRDYLYFFICVFIDIYYIFIFYKVSGMTRRRSVRDLRIRYPCLLCKECPKGTTVPNQDISCPA